MIENPLTLKCPLRNDRRLIVIAHRGGVVDEERPENSLMALEEAIEKGYSHVEVDARATRDGHVVCIHDESLLRAAGIVRRVGDLTLNEIAEIRLTKSRETIPTFEQFCGRCAGRVNLMVDLKGAEEKHIDRYAREIEEALRSHDLLDEALMLINRIPINNQEKIARKFLGKARISWRSPLAETNSIFRQVTEPHKLYYVFNHGEDFTKEVVEGFHALGLPVIASINQGHYRHGDPIEQGLFHIQEMLDLGVEGLQIDSIYDKAVFG